VLVTEQDKNVFGCMGLVAVVALGWGIIHVLGQGIEMLRDPEAYAARQVAAIAEAEAQERRAQQAKLERDWEEFEGKERQTARRVAAEEARDRANRAALQRYAECQVRNQTPGYCTEDWRPTEDITAMNEIAREGRF